MCRVNVVRKVPQDGMSPADEGVIPRYNIAFAVHCQCISIEASVHGDDDG